VKTNLLSQTKDTKIEQGKVASIDKNTGKVFLYLRNGLVSCGTYLYDINDLRVGNSVLVSKVSNAYVILNKIPSNTPRGKGFTVKGSVNLSKKRYWVGNSGDWNDSAHWSYTSGGPGGAPVPDETCDVVIDVNSITLPDQTITVRT
jgi:hypothetical protein